GVLQATIPGRKAADHEEGDQPLALGTTPGSAPGQSLQCRVWRPSPRRPPRPPAHTGPQQTAERPPTPVPRRGSVPLVFTPGPRAIHTASGAGQPHKPSRGAGNCSRPSAWIGSKPS